MGKSSAIWYSWIFWWKNRRRIRNICNSTSWYPLHACSWAIFAMQWSVWLVEPSLFSLDCISASTSGKWVMIWNSVCFLLRFNVFQQYHRAITINTDYYYYYRCVVIVLVASRGKMDVPRFLVCNLAMADFCMGLYLGFLAIVDASTLGEFRKYAIHWQFSPGCQVSTTLLFR